MKRRSLIVIAICSFIVQSCIVKSLHPFYTADDLIFRNELVNTWVDQDSGKWKITPYKFNKNAYEMHWLGKGGKDVVFLVHLFQLENERYLDFLPYAANDDENLSIFDLHLVPTHSIAKLVVLTNSEVQIKWFNEEWMKTLFEQNRIKISHETVMDEESKNKNDKNYILTASTEELQKFILKFGKDDAAFDNDNTVWLRLKKAI